MATAQVELPPWALPGVKAFLTAYSLDRAADAVFFVALGWLAASSGDPLLTTTILAVSSVARVIMLFFGGVFGDRLGLIRASVWTLVVRIVLMFLFGVTALNPVPNPWLLGTIAFVFGVADALHLPAMDGTSGILVRGEGIQRVQGVQTAAGNVAEVLGAPLAGFLLAWRQDSTGWVAAGLLLAAWGCMLRLSRRAETVVRPDDDPESSSSLLSDLRAGLARVTSDPALRNMFLVFTVANLAATPAIVAGLPLAAKANGWGSFGYALTTLGFAAGGIAGGLSLARWADRPTRPGRVSLLLILPGAACLAGVATAANPVVAMLWCFGAGALFAGGAGLLAGFIKVVTEPRFMGRVMALRQVAIYAAIPVGMTGYGLLAAAFSARTAGLVAAVALASVTGLGAAGPLWSLTKAKSAASA